MMNPFREEEAIDDLAAELGVTLAPLVRMDSERSLRLLAEEAGVTIPPLLFCDVTACVAFIRDSQSGGSETLEWTLGADYALKFSTDQYWWGGQERTRADLTQILGGSELFPGQDYDPDAHIDGGYNGATFMAAIGSLRDDIKGGGFTFLAQFEDNFTAEMTEATFASDLIFRYLGVSSGGAINDQISDNLTDNPEAGMGENGPHSIAATFTDGFAAGTVPVVAETIEGSDATLDPDTTFYLHVTQESGDGLTNVLSAEFTTDS